MPGIGWVGHVMARGSMVAARILENVAVSETMRLLVLEPVEPTSPPGPMQFYMVWLPGLEEVPMSTADYEDGRVYILVKPRGPTTRALANSRPGSLVGLRGPFGKPFQPRGMILGVAGGSGVAPFIYMARLLGPRLTVVYGARTAGDVGSVPRLLEIHSAHVLVATEDGSKGYQGTSVDLALEVLGGERPDYVVAAGPPAMLLALGRALEPLGVESWVSVEATVKCGIGACGSCTLPGTTFLLCLDGPVFRYRDALGWLREAVGEG